MLTDEIPTEYLNRDRDDLLVCHDYEPPILRSGSSNYPEEIKNAN